MMNVGAPDSTELIHESNHLFKMFTGIVEIIGGSSLFATD
jgi:hypothetical protein